MPNGGEHRKDGNILKKNILPVGKRKDMVLGEAGAKPGYICRARNVLNFSTKVFLMAETNKHIFLESPRVCSLISLKLFLTFVICLKRLFKLYIFL